MWSWFFVFFLLKLHSNFLTFFKLQVWTRYTTKTLTTKKLRFKDVESKQVNEWEEEREARYRAEWNRDERKKRVLLVKRPCLSWWSVFHLMFQFQTSLQRWSTMWGKINQFRCQWYAIRFKFFCCLMLRVLNLRSIIIFSKESLQIFFTDYQSKNRQFHQFSVEFIF